MILWLLAFVIPVLQAQPVVTQLSTRWHGSNVIETGMDGLAFVVIMPSKDKDVGRLFAVDSSGQILQMAFLNQQWTVLDSITVGERVTTGCAAALRPDEQWSLVLGTASGRVVEMRCGTMGWSKHEFATHKAPLRQVRATEPARPGPSQVIVVDADGLATNWYVGGSGRWNSKQLPTVIGGISQICFDQANGLRAVVAGPRGIIVVSTQDSLGNWTSSAWDTMSSACSDLAPSSDPTGRDLCIFYVGSDGHLRFLFFGHKDDLTSRLACAIGARHVIGKGEQRRFNEFFAMAGQEFCLFEYDPAILEWIKVPIRTIPGTVVATVFGPARGSNWATIYAATSDGKIYEMERDGLEVE